MEGRTSGILPDGCQAEHSLGGQKNRCYTGVKFPKGVADKIHSHPEANQITIGLTGEVEMPNGIMPLSPNMVITASKGVKHGASNITKESIVLFFWDGPPKPKVEE